MSCTAPASAVRLFGGVTPPQLGGQGALESWVLMLMLSFFFAGAMRVGMELEGLSLLLLLYSLELQTQPHGRETGTWELSLSLPQFRHYYAF